MCREFQQPGVQVGETSDVYGTACQQADGAWQFVIPRGAEASRGRNCRSYAQEIVANGGTVNAYGTACLQPDGSWRIVSAPSLDGAETPIRDAYAFAPEPAPRQQEWAPSWETITPRRYTEVAPYATPYSTARERALDAPLVERPSDRGWRPPERERPLGFLERAGDLLMGRSRAAPVDAYPPDHPGRGYGWRTHDERPRGYAYGYRYRYRSWPS
jgi:hypothetical protein